MLKSACKILWPLALLGVIAGGATAQEPSPQLSTAPPATSQGEYAARLADCAACHTAPGGKPFAGGRRIASPFGTIWSSNITPDHATGIGDYTLDDFRAALYEGKRKDGTHLYPAMPYENYRKISEEDVRKLYAYFMNEVTPVSHRVPVTDLTFPFNQRWGIGVWDWLSQGKTGFRPRYNNATLDRGAYIVEALAHCGACHSPRDVFFSQEGTSAEAPSFLTGGEVGGWSAPDLRGPKSAPQNWSADELKAFLATGRNSHAAVAGEMSLVIAESLQYASDSDLDAVVAYLRHLGGGGAKAPVTVSGEADKTVALLKSADPKMDLGARLYLDNCNACHEVTGKGASGVFPALDGNSLVTAKQTVGLIDVILNGSRLPSTRQRPAPLAMPPFGDRLSDEEVAALATFVRSAWSNDAGPVSASEVAAERGHKQSFFARQ